MEFIQMVKEHNHYSLSDVEQVFGLGPADAARLLREVGFVREPDDPSRWPDQWVDPSE